MEAIEDGLNHLGLMQGDLAPLKRGLVGGAAGALVVYGFKPAFMFNPDGSARPFALGHPDKSGNPTWFPYWLGIAAPAVILGVLI